MRALRVELNREILLTDSAPEPVAAPGEAMIRIHRVLLGHVDALAASPGAGGVGSHTGTLGHMFVGTVKSVNIAPDAGSVAQSRRSVAGKRVVCAPSFACGQCDLCRGGLSAHCRGRTVLGTGGRDGCCADRVCVPLSSLTIVPDSLPDDDAIFAHPLACAVHASQMLRAENKSFVTILGDSLSALLAAQMLARVNKSVRLLSARADRWRLCERWGIRHRAVNEAGRRQDQDAVVECTGTVAGLRLALHLVRPRGVVLMMSPRALMTCPVGASPAPRGAGFGSVAPGEVGRPDGGDGGGGPWGTGAGGWGDLDLTIASSNEIQIIGCREGPLPDALGLLAERTIDVSMLSTAKVKLGQAAAVLAHLADPDHLPFVIDLEPGR